MKLLNIKNILQEIKMDKKRIPDIFTKSSYLEIPFFQRSYVWQEENWLRFIEDCKDISKNKKNYFFGTYIIKQVLTETGASHGELRRIIDGQQRITTLILFLLALTNELGCYEKYFKQTFMSYDGEILLEHNHNDKDVFDDLVYNRTISKDKQEQYSKKLIYQAYIFFKTEIKKDPTMFDVEDILKYVYFVPIDLMPDDDEQQIFDTINSLGIKLNTAELLKNHLFNRNEIQLYKKYWEPCFEGDDKEFWDKKVGSRDDRTNIDLFLYSYINIKNREDIRYKNLFQSYKDYILKKDFNSSAEKKENFIKEIIDYANVYRKYINPDIERANLRSNKNSIDRINILIFSLDTSTILPYCLYVLLHAEQEECKRILGYIETYIIRRMICHESTKNYSKKFKTFINEQIVTFNDFKNKILGDTTDTEDKLPTDEEIEIKSRYNHTNPQAKGILYLLESGLRNPTKHSTDIKPIIEYDLEHIMPKTWETVYWSLPEDKNTNENRKNRIEHIGLLGNKTILANGLNKSIKNKDFLTKKEGDGDNFGYDEYAKGLTTFQFDDLTEWNEDSIEQRQKMLIKYILEIWPYDSVR